MPDIIGFQMVIVVTEPDNIVEIKDVVAVQYL
jgi:hypothetical protein